MWAHTHTGSYTVVTVSLLLLVVAVVVGLSIKALCGLLVFILSCPLPLHDLDAYLQGHRMFYFKALGPCIISDGPHSYSWLPSLMCVCITLSRLKVFSFMKEVILKSYKEQERKRSSKWLQGKLVPVSVLAVEVVELLYASSFPGYSNFHTPFSLFTWDPHLLSVHPPGLPTPGLPTSLPPASSYFHF